MITICVFLQQLAESLVEFGAEWEFNPGDGAFYGPKVSDYVFIILSLTIIWLR